MNIRPPAKELTRHDDKKIAKAAQRVLDAAKHLDAVYDEYAGKAALRKKQADLEAELAKVKSQLRGSTVTAKADTKAIRAWARDNGYDVPSVGVIPKTVMAAYEQANAA